ncbi:unnamed protein product [Adineta ricciae]|uniref:Uncharacterized protein n=1 Tax=Adineta ricciae TaxID=249248 RepID=A0A813PCK4_ADIRI|nr:unnamed protein product [Adineta ricciae]CAF1102303.1 unnamed protein product [Adineta ricciae]
MSLLKFPEEILLDIFEYFYFSELIYSFYDIMCVKPHFEELITTRLRSINLSKVDLRCMTKSQFLYMCRYFKSHLDSLDQIQHLILSNQYTFGQIRSFLSQVSFDQLIHLRKLHLIQPALDEYHILFPTRSTQLKHLILDNPECDDNGRVILIDEMDELVTLTIQSDHSIQFRSQYNRIENLTLKKLNFLDLIGFSTFFPNLHYLDVTLTGTDIDLSQVHLPLLTILKLRSSRVPHDLCEHFFLNLLQLRQLFYSNEIDCRKIPVVDGYRCQAFIEQLPLLEEFQLDLHLLNTHSTDICEITGSFQNAFYLSKNWNIVCESRVHSNCFHIYSVPMEISAELSITTDSFVSSPVLPIDNLYGNVQHLKLNMTANWPLVTRFFPSVDSLELSQLTHSRMIPTISIISYLNKSIFLSKLNKLILPSPCHFDDTLLCYLLQQSAPNISNLDISCHYLLRLIKEEKLQSPLPIRILTLRDDYLPAADQKLFIDFFKPSLTCLSLFLQNNNSLSDTIQSFLDEFRLLFSLDILLNDLVSMLIHVQLCQMLQQRPKASAELRPMNIRIWQK